MFEDKFPVRESIFDLEAEKLLESISSNDKVSLDNFENFLEEIGTELTRK